MTDVSGEEVPTRSDVAPEAAWRILPVDAVLFDLDGTLVDTAPDLGAALNRVRTGLGLEAVPLSDLRAHSSHGARGLLGAGMGVGTDDPRFPALRDAFLDAYESALCVDTALFPGVAALLDTIEARSLKWGIVTNKATRFTSPLLEALKLSGRPHVVVCGDTTPHVKPHPAPLLHAAQQLGVAPARCVYVGDAERDIIAGAAAGMPTVVARYGYIQSEEAPHLWLSAGIIDDPRELLSWLPVRGQAADR